MRYSTLQSALIVVLLAAAGCSSPPTMDAEVQARRQNGAVQRQSTSGSQQSASEARQSESGSYKRASGYQKSSSAQSSSAQSAPVADGNITVNQVNKVTYYMDGGKSTSGYLGIGTSVAQLNAMLNISVTDSSDVHFSQVNKVNILHDDDEHPEGGNREVAEAFMGVYLVFGDAVEQVNVMENVTINGASNIRVDQVNKISLVDSAGRGRDGYLIFPQAGLTEQLNVLDATVTNSTNVRFDQINSIFIIDADDFKDLYRSTETEKDSYLRRQYQSRMLHE